MNLNDTPGVALGDDTVDVARDDDGELMIDWSPGKGRMVTMSLRADGRLSYAFVWDGEKAHGTAQMPDGVVVDRHQSESRHPPMDSGAKK